MPENGELVAKSVAVLNSRSAEIIIGRLPSGSNYGYHVGRQLVIGGWADMPSVGSSGRLIHQRLSYSKRKS